jgi:hypothetical protein
MRSQNEVHDHFETQDRRAADSGADDRLKIEEILRRAQESHCEHGGVFGYDFEDWLQAWRELPSDAAKRS